MSHHGWSFALYMAAIRDMKKDQVKTPPGEDRRVNLELLRPDELIKIIRSNEALCLRAADALEEYSWKEPQARTDELIDELRKAV